MLTSCQYVNISWSYHGIYEFSYIPALYSVLSLLYRCLSMSGPLAAFSELSWVIVSLPVETWRAVGLHEEVFLMYCLSAGNADCQVRWARSCEWMDQWVSLALFSSCTRLSSLLGSSSGCGWCCTSLGGRKIAPGVTFSRVYAGVLAPGSLFRCGGVDLAVTAPKTINANLYNLYHYHSLHTLYLYLWYSQYL